MYLIVDNVGVLYVLDGGGFIVQVSQSTIGFLADQDGSLYAVAEGLLIAPG